MKKTIWKPFLLFFSSLALAAVPTAITNGCASDEFAYMDVTYNSLFSPEVVQVPALEPLFYSYHTYYGSFKYWDNEIEEEWIESRIGKTENLKEWLQFFRQKPTLADIDSVVYSADEALLTEIEKYVTKKKNQLPDKWKKNTLVKTFRKQKKTQEALHYIQYVRQCAPYVLGESVDWDNWSEEEENETAEENEGISPENLITEGLKRYQTSKSEFMKLRYAYQVVRLAHYTQEPEKCITLYDQLVEPLKTESQLKYWALSHKAGALLNADQQEEALYLWSKVFANCLSRRIDAYDGFNRYGGGVCASCFDYAKTDQEKVAIWFLQGISLEPKGLQAMQQIYNLNPKSEELDVLLAREINKSEDYLLPSGYESLSAGMQVSGADEVKLYTQKLAGFVNQVAKSNTTRKPYLWQFASGYLAFLQQQPQAAQTYFDQVKKSGKADPLLLENIRLIETVLYLNDLKEINPTAEQKIVENLEWLESRVTSNLRTSYPIELTYQTLKNHYQNSKNLIRYELISHGDNLTETKNYDVLEGLIAFLNTPEKTPFEKYFINRFRYKVDHLKEMQGTILLSNYAFADAAAKFKEIKNDSVLIPLPADPFTSRIKDCHDCDYQEPKTKTYTKLTLSEEMLRLQNQLKTKTANQAETHMKLANAYYNFTYFGNSWMALEYYRQSSYSFGKLLGPETTEKTKFNNNNNFYDCRQAQNHYEFARRAAANNPELAAKAAFMAAKCEQNRFLAGPDFKHGLTGPKLPAKYRNYFRLLKQRYSQTKYYQEIINECGDFASFIVKKQAKKP